jgi:hypothetical protein
MNTRFFLGLTLAAVLGACGTNQNTRTVTVTPQGDTIISHGDRPLAQVAGTLKSGTKVQAITQDEISSQHNRVGDIVHATLTNNIKDVNGQVIFREGTPVDLRITDLQPTTNNANEGTVGLQVVAMKTNGRTYTVGSTVDRDSYSTQDRGPSVDRDKVLIGAGAGAVVGGLIAGSVKGAVIGGLLGGAAGAVVGNQGNNGRRDVIVKPGTKLEFKLQEPVVIYVS